MDPQPQRPPKTEHHPWAIFFHWVFKVAAIFFYLFSSLFTSYFIMTFVVSVVLVALDFWVVRNSLNWAAENAHLQMQCASLLGPMHVQHGNC